MQSTIKRTIETLLVSYALFGQVENVQGQLIVGNWNFNEGSGSVAYDSSGFHNDGQLSGVTWSRDTPSGEGFSAEFRDEWNPYISVGYPIPNLSLNLKDSFTFEAWAKLSSKFGSPIIDKLNSPNVNSNHPYFFGIVPSLDSQNLRAYVHMEGINDGGICREFGLVGETNLEINRWYHLCANYDGLNLRVFVDGHLDGSIVADHLDILDTTGALNIGGSYSFGPSSHFHGWLDDVRITNNSVPEPEFAMGIFGLSALGIGVYLRRRQKT